MNLNNISREGWAILLFFLFLATQEAGFGAIFILMAILFMVGGFSNAQARQNQQRRRSRNGRVVVGQGSRRGSQEDEDPFLDVEPRPVSTDAVQPHALDAVRAAGRDPDRLAVLPVDVGVLSFKDNSEPVINRDWDVMDDVDYIQPFVQLRLPQDATGRVRFEILDPDNELVFVHEDDYQFVRGRNLVLPSTRLPVHDEQLKDGQWKLRIKADRLLIAEHIVTWGDPDTASEDLRRHIAEDGEISSELRAMLAESRLEQISLDDLLAHQEEEERIQRQQRR